MFLMSDYTIKNFGPKGSEAISISTRCTETKVGDILMMQTVRIKLLFSVAQLSFTARNSYDEKLIIRKIVLLFRKIIFCKKTITKTFPTNWFTFYNQNNAWDLYTEF